MKQKDAAPKRKGFGLFLIAALALLIAAALVLGIPGLAAMRGSRAAQAGDYVQAEAAYRDAAGHGLFNRLFHAEEKAQALHPAACYQQGETALAEGRFEEALAFFTEAGEYRDAAGRAAETCYAQGEAALAEGRFEAAMNAFTAAGSYRDAAARLPETSFRAGQALLAEGRFRDAAAAFLAAGDCEGAEEQLFACLADAAREAVEAGDLALAEEYLALAKDHPDAKIRGEIRLYLARGCAEAGQLEEALKHLSSVNYDKDDQALRDYEAQTRYLLGLACLDAGDFDAAQRQFAQLAGYEDADHLAQSARLGKVLLLSDEEDWFHLAYEAEQLDLSRLDDEELGRYQTRLYDDAALCEGRGDIVTAFSLYRLSGKGDFQERMDACNELYIAAPRELRFSNEESGQLQINRLTALYFRGEVSFTFDCTVTVDDAIIHAYLLPRVPGPDDVPYLYTAQLVPQGTSTVSLSLAIGHITNPDTYLKLMLHSRNQEDGPVSYAELSWTEAAELDTDLYGRVIP